MTNTSKASPPLIDLDGEKIADERVTEIFRDPPGAPPRFLRNSLIVGCRGVGKTTLLRFHKELHTGIAVHISLSTIFGSLTKQTGFGPLAMDIPGSLEPGIAGKATSLLALGIVNRLVQKDVQVDADALLECLPDLGFACPKTLDRPWLDRCRKAVLKLAIEDFTDLSISAPLFDFVETLGESVQRQANGPLLLLLDRADMVQAPALIPVFQLLDQSSHFIALVAMRPGSASRAVSTLDEKMAGDTYGIVHLGIEPRSAEWVEFVENAIEAQIGPSFSRVPKHVKESIISISRDSLRTSLELFARYLAKNGSSGETDLVTAMKDLRENYLAAAQNFVQKYHPDFRHFVHELRSDAVTRFGSITGPLVLSVIRKPADDFFTPSRASRFVDLGLRSGSICMPAGQQWYPGLRPTQIELPPLLVWENGDVLWSTRSNEPILLERTEDELFQASRGRPTTPTIFVAYRMNAPESERFRLDLESAVQKHPNLNRFKIIDGHVPAGVEWATVIRHRITRSKVVVGDVTGMRREVLFELGLAYGLRRVVVPAISAPEKRSELPRWLNAKQLGDYATSAGISSLVTSITTLLSDPEFERLSPPPTPVPGLAIWLRELKWNETALDQFRMAAQNEGLRLEVLDDDTPDEILIRRAASANLLIVSLDGTQADALMHYVCGAVAAKPKMAYRQTLSRSVLILQADSSRSLVAEGLRRCPNTVKIIDISRVGQETEDFGKRYNVWLSKFKKQR